MTVHANDAHPFPIYNARYRAIFPLLDADGDPVSPSSADTELSQDTGTFADATNEQTEIATSSGVVYIDLINTETDCTSLVIKAASTGAKTTIMTLYPLRMPVLRTGTAQAGAATTITLDSGASAVNDFYNGCYVNITNNSPANAQGQARLITDYDGSTKVATVATWGTNPSSASTFEILVPPGMQNIMWAGTPVADPSVSGVPEVDLTHSAGTAITSSGGRPEVNTSHAAGVAWASGAITAAVIATGAIDADALAADTITAAKIATNAIGADELADGAITAATFAAGAIDAAAIATDAIDADAIAANAIDAGAIATGAITAAKFAAGAIDAAAIADGAIDAATFAAGAINAAAVAADAIGAAELAADAVAEIADAVWDEIRSGHTTAGSYGEASLATVLRTGVVDSGSTSQLVDSALIGAVNGLHNNSWVVILSSTNDATYSVGRVDAFDNTTGTITFSPSIPSGVVAGDTYAIIPAAFVGVATIGSSVITATSIAANAIGAAELAADAVAEIADAVWDEAIAGHLAAGSTGEALSDAGAAGDPWGTALPGAYGAGTAGKIVGDNLNATVSSRASQTSVDTIDDFLDTEVAAIKTVTDQITFGTANRVNAQVYGVEAAAITAGAIAADAIGASELAADAVAEIADAVWDEATAGHVAAGSFGKLGADVLEDTGTTLQAEVDGIQADTEDIQSRLPAALVSGRIDADVGAMQAGTVTAAVVATGAIDADALAADAVAEIWAKTVADLAAVPGATATALDALNWVYQLARNKLTQTSDTLTVFRDDGSTAAAASAISDSAGTYTRGEFA